MYSYTPVFCFAMRRSLAVVATALRMGSRSGSIAANRYFDRARFIGCLSDRNGVDVWNACGAWQIRGFFAWARHSSMTRLGLKSATHSPGYPRWFEITLQPFSATKLRFVCVCP